jgi:hypothetical protein
MSMNQDAVMRMSTEQLRRELKRLQAEDPDQHAGDIALIQYELYRRDLHGGDYEYDIQ